MKKLKPLLEPEVKLEQILAYKHDDPSTHTHVRLINEICERMSGTHVRSVEEIAQELGIEQFRLTHTMEVLTGYSLHQIRVEMLIKRWHDYHAAHPKCKPSELAAAIGYDNYNAYWRFLGRYKKRFPEVKEKATNCGWRGFLEE